MAGIKDWPLGRADFCVGFDYEIKCEIYHRSSNQHMTNGEI